MKMRKLKIEEIEKISKQEDIKKIAVENFLMSVHNNQNAMIAIMNLDKDSKLYNWNDATIYAIKEGIRLSSFSKHKDKILKYKYSDIIHLKKNANITISGTIDEKPPNKYINDNEGWCVDDYENSTGMINVNRRLTPYPGAFCSWVHESEVIDFDKK